MAVTSLIIKGASLPIVSRVRFPMVSLKFFSDNPSCRTMALGSTQPLTEMSTRCISRG